MSIILDHILDNTIAHDILYGNTSRDMVERAISNDELHSVYDRLRILQRSTEYIEENFKSWLKQEHESDFYFIGNYTAFLTVLYLLSKEKAVTIITDMNATLDPNNMIRLINQEFLKR